MKVCAFGLFGIGPNGFMNVSARMLWSVLNLVTCSRSSSS